MMDFLNFIVLFVNSIIDFIDKWLKSAPDPPKITKPKDDFVKVPAKDPQYKTLAFLADQDVLGTSEDSEPPSKSIKKDKSTKKSKKSKKSTKEEKEEKKTK